MEISAHLYALNMLTHLVWAIRVLLLFSAWLYYATESIIYECTTTDTFDV